MRAAGPGGSAHCEPEGGRGAEGPGSEGGARLTGAESAVAAAPPPQPGGWLGAGRRGPGRGRMGAAGRGGGGGRLHGSSPASGGGTRTPARRRSRPRHWLPAPSARD